MKKIILSFFSFFCCAVGFAQVKLYVAENGNDRNLGTIAQPFRSLENAVKKAISLKGKDVHVQLRGGTYALAQTIAIASNDYQVSSLSIEPYANEKVIITGSKQIRPQWKPYKNGILQANIALAAAPDQLFVNGKTMQMARYPNYDPEARVFNGTAADAISEERVAKWKEPKGGYIHALHYAEWGDFHYQMTGKDAAGKLTYEGGWQNNRPAQMHKKHRFVENIFEELDAPGEWFYDTKSKTLFVYPPKGIDFAKAKITLSTLTDLFHFNGTENKPIKNITLNCLTITQTARTFMLVKEPLLRSDWCIYRGGAILMDGAENVKINNCKFYELGGNAVFLSNYNRNNSVKDNLIHHIGGNAIAFVGSADAVRSPAFRYENFVPWEQMDFQVGPKTNNYPQYCTAAGNLIHHIGTIEKQVAAVQISMASHITASHNSIYRIPRSGINVSEGTWGGHVLEFNDIFYTVLETGDHGAFNSWGRDRYWRPERNIIDSIVAAKPGIELLDVVSPIIIRNNRFQCDHGWDVDLDDGSSNYQIYNNLCLNGGLKLREGYHRTVYNNILVNNTFHPHVWLKNSGDIFKHNIVTSAYAPILMNHWGKTIDSNLFLTKDGLTKAQALNLDHHSAYGDAMFVNAAEGDFRVKPGSPALKMGFKNFEMDFGVTAPELKALAEKPKIAVLVTTLGDVKGKDVEWLGAQFKSIETLGERSAAGLPDQNGVLVLQVPASSIAAKSDLRKGDVIVKMGDQEVNSISDLLKVYQSIKWMGHAAAVIVRNQANQKVEIVFK